MGGFVEITFDPVKGLENVRASLLSILLKWWEGHQLGDNPIDDMTQCMMQMMMLKIRSLQVLFEGVPMVPNNQPQTLYYDLSSIAATTRGIYELAFIFHNIFVSTKDDTEREILMNIWKIRGFNNRLKAFVPEELKEDAKRNTIVIKELRNRTSQLLDSLEILPSARIKIEKVINKESSILKGYKYVKDDNNRIIDFIAIDFTDASSMFNHKWSDDIYSFLSYHSHPSYLGLIQFGQIKGMEQHYETGGSFLYSACFCASKFTNDACEVLTDGIEIKRMVVPDFRATINFFEDM
jgi:hypothetical protein